MKRMALTSFVLTLILAALPQASSVDRHSAVLLQAAQVKDTIQGNPQAAILLYQQAFNEAKTDRTTAAKALLGLATAYEKTGSPEARGTFARILRDFPDQTLVAAAAKARLAALSARLGAMGPAVSTAQAGASSSRRIQIPNIVLTDISLDGTTAVGTERGSLVLLNLPSSTLIRLNVSGAGPQLSPDGRQLAYQENAVAAIPPPLRIVATAPGSTPWTLVSDPQRGIAPIGWSADGKSVIATVRPVGEGAGALASVAVSDGTIRTLKTFERRDAVPGPGYTIVFRVSPDGRFVAYNDRDTVYVVSLDGQTETAVAQIAGRTQLQAWSADGNRLFFTNTRSNGPASSGLQWDLWSVPVRDGAASGTPWLLQSNFEGRLLGASTTGTLYSFRSPSDADTQRIFVADRLAGSRIIETVPGQSAAASPDGATMALLRENGNYHDPVVRSVATGAERLCRLNSVGPGSPVWLHDGSGFLVHLSRLPSGAPGPGAFYFINATSCESTLVLADTADRTRGGSVALSLDNKTLYAAKGHSRPQGTPAFVLRQTPWTGIVGVDLETGIESPVATFPGNGFPSSTAPSLALSPDGRTLALMVFARQTDARDEGRIVTVGVNGSGYREVFGPFPASGAGGATVRWTPDGQSILFPMMKDGHVGWRIMRVAAGGGQPVFDGLDSGSPVGDIAVPTFGPSGPSIDVLPDGRMIVATRTVATNELWAIDSIAR